MKRALGEHGISIFHTPLILCPVINLYSIIFSLYEIKIFFFLLTLSPLFLVVPCTQTACSVTKYYFIASLPANNFTWTINTCFMSLSCSRK